MDKKILAAILLSLMMFSGTALAIPAPSALSSVDVWQKIRGISFAKLANPFAITGVGVISYPGDTFSCTPTSSPVCPSATLVNKGTATLPDADASDGIVTHLYQTYRMTDQAANKVQDGYEEITASVAPQGTVSYSISLPIATSTPSGKYSIISVLFSITQTWNRNTNTWTTGDAVVIDKQGVTFDVQTPTPPPQPSTSQVLDKITALFQGLLCWIKGIFGSAC